MSIDLGDYISKTLDLIYAKDIKTIRVYGFKAFAECLRAYAEVEYDYVNTLRKQTDANQINQTYLDPNRGARSTVRTHTKNESSYHSVPHYHGE